MVAVLPASVPVPTTLASPAATSTVREPSRYVPSDIPAALMASVTRAIRSDPTLRTTRR